MSGPSILATGLAAVAVLSLSAPARSSWQQLPETAASSGVGLQQVGDTWIGSAAPYRVELSSDAVEFAPTSIQSTSPDAGLRLRLSAIRRGGVAVSEIGSGALPGPRVHGDDAVHYLHPQGITERYQLRGDGVELSYVFPRRPAGSGDLIVRIAVDAGSLSAPHSVGERTLDFSSETGGAVHIGEVTGIDAAGRTIPGWMNWDGAGLELVLPEAFVENASYPMVLDPLIGGTFFVTDQLPFDDSAPDVAYDATFDQYLFVWERLTASEGYNVVGRRVSGATGQPIGSDFTIFGGVSDNRRPSVASITGQNRFFVACEAASGGRSNILCCHVEADPAAVPQVDGRVNLTASQTLFDSAPDVGGCATSASGNPVVVFERAGSGIWAWQVEPWVDPFPFPHPSHRVVRSLHVSGQNANARRPTICRSGGTRDRFVVAWESTGNYIGARALDRNLNPLSAAGLISASPGTTVLRPDVAGDGERFLLVYQQFESGSSGSSDVWAINLVLPARASDLPGFNRKAALVGVPGVDEYAPSLCMPGSHFAVTCTEEQPNGRRVARTVNVTAGNWATCGRVARPGFNGTIQTKMAARREGDASVTSDEAMIAFERRSGAPAGDIAAQRWETFGGGVISDRGGQCGGSVTLSTSGEPFSLGNRDFALDVSVGVPAAQAVLALAFGPNPATFRCGSGCELLFSDVSFGFSLQGSSARFPLPVPCDPNLFGLHLHAQALVVTPGIDPCNLAPVSLSNRLEMVLGD